MTTVFFGAGSPAYVDDLLSTPSLERFGLILVFVVIFLVPGFRGLLGSMMEFLYGVIRSVVTLGGMW